MKTVFNVARPLVGRVVLNDSMNRRESSSFRDGYGYDIRNDNMDAVTVMPSGSVVKTRAYAEGEIDEFLIYPNYIERG